MRKKIIITILIALILTIIIYYSKKETKIYYIALGDGITLGETPYNSFGYSYSDYIKEYLEDVALLKFYTKDFAEEDMRIDDLVNLFEQNKKVIVNDKKISINEAVNKANLITLSIGSSDLYYKLKINNNYLLNQDVKDIIKDVDKIFVKIDNCIKYLRTLYKKELYVIGYYNPITNGDYVNIQILDDVFEYTDKLFLNLSKKYNFKFIEVNKIIGKNEELIPNPNNVHLNYKGYKIIGNQVISSFNFWQVA